MDNNMVNQSVTLVSLKLTEQGWLLTKEQYVGNLRGKMLWFTADGKAGRRIMEDKFHEVTIICNTIDEIQASKWALTDDISTVISELRSVIRKQVDHNVNTVGQLQVSSNKDIS